MIRKAAADDERDVAGRAAQAVIDAFHAVDQAVAHSDVDAQETRQLHERIGLRLENEEVVAEDDLHAAGRSGRTSVAVEAAERRREVLDRSRQMRRAPADESADGVTDRVIRAAEPLDDGPAVLELAAVRAIGHPVAAGADEERFVEDPPAVRAGDSARHA